MEKSNFKLEATSDEGFPFTFYIEKAIASEEDMVIEGIASTVNIDHDNERMSPEALVSMAEIINGKNVPLRIEHQKDEDAICGNVFDAHVDERNQLWIKARLDPAHTASPMLYKRLKDGMKLGLSVGGRVKRAVKEFSEAAGKTVKTFYDVMLEEVSVTQRPANYDSWLLAKSIISKGEDSSKWYESSLYNEFLSETGGMDFMQSFAKSVPNASWKKIELSSNINKDMTKEMKKGESEEETKEKAMDTEETKEKAMEDTEEKEKSQGDEAFKSYVVKGFETLTSILSSLVSKSETKKSAEETYKDAETEEKSMDDETKEKSQEDEETKEKKQKSEDKEESSEKAYGDEYKMKSILDRMGNLTKAMDDSETKEKAQEDDEETKKSKGGESLGTFLGGLESFLNTFEEKMEKSGKSVPGFRNEFINMLRTDPEIQKSIRELGEKEPGFRKSRQFGNAFIKDRDGRMFSLTPIVDAKDAIEKSAKDNAGKSFKDVYKQEFSSVSQEAAG